MKQLELMQEEYSTVRKEGMHWQCYDALQEGVRGSFPSVRAKEIKMEQRVMGSAMNFSVRTPSSCAPG